MVYQCIYSLIHRFGVRFKTVFNKKKMLGHVSCESSILEPRATPLIRSLQYLYVYFIFQLGLFSKVSSFVPIFFLHHVIFAERNKLIENIPCII